MLIGYRQFSQSNCLQLFFGINSPRVGRAWKTDLAMRWTCTRVFSGHTHGQLLMLVHQLWLLLPVTALCVGEHKRLLYEQGLTHDVEALFSGSLHIVSFSSTKCRSKHLLLLTSYTSYQKAYCPSLPISSIHAQRHLFSWTYFPSYSPLVWCLSTRASTLGRAIEKSRRLKHIFPRPASIYFWLANTVILRAGELCCFHFIGRRTHKLESDGDDIETCFFFYT